MIKLLLKGLITVGLALLVGCANEPIQDEYKDNVSAMHSALTAGIKQDKKASDQVRNARLPSSVGQALMPSSSSNKTESDHDKLLDISVHDVEAATFFKGLAHDTDYSLLVSPKVTGTISLELKQVNLQQVLHAVRELYGYHIQKTEYGYTIYPEELETRIFYIDKLAITRLGSSSVKLNSGGTDLTDSSGNSSQTDLSSSTIKTSQKDSFWNDLKASINSIIRSDSTSSRGDSAEKSSDEAATGKPSVSVNVGTGVVVVSAFPRQMDMVEKYIRSTKNILSREVIIEAQILDVELKKQYSTGIDWGALTASGATSTTDIMTPATGLLGNVYKLSMTGNSGNFNYAIQLLASQGQVSVLSKPRLSVINNQNAVIKVGDDEYFVTSVSSTVTSSSGDDDDSNTLTSTIGLSAFFSGLSLDITPQITADKSINLHIHPSLSRVSEDDKTITVDDQVSVLPLAKSQIRETDTVVKAKDGQVIIIGGLMETGSSLNESGLPIGTKYEQALGGITKSRSNAGLKDELIILMRAVIVEDGVWEKELSDTASTAYQHKPEETFTKKA